MRAEKGHTLKVDGVISPALGGIPVGHELGRVLNVKAIFAEKQDNKLVASLKSSLQLVFVLAALVIIHVYFCFAAPNFAQPKIFTDILLQAALWA